MTCQILMITPCSLQLTAASANQSIDALYYSAEIRFGTGISYSFIDVIRKRANMSNVLFTPGQDKGEVLVKYMANLLEMARVLVKSEERLMKINAPVDVIGDLKGSLPAVMAIEKLRCPTVPVIQSNLVFLGNYICPKAANNVEVLCFLLALKTQSPNKVFLLRGHNESNKEATRILLKECEAKYGSVARQVCSLLVSVLEVLPFAVIIDESILCLHSGPPIVSAGNQVTMIADIPSPLANVEDNAVALEVGNTEISFKANLISLPYPMADPQRHAHRSCQRQWTGVHAEAVSHLHAAQQSVLSHSRQLHLHISQH